MNDNTTHNITTPTTTLPVLLPWPSLPLTPSCSKPMKIMTTTNSTYAPPLPPSTPSPLSHPITFKVITTLTHPPLLIPSQFLYFLHVYRGHTKPFLPAASKFFSSMLLYHHYDFSHTAFFICNIKNRDETVIANTI